jgi:hypothetical protein
MVFPSPALGLVNRLVLVPFRTAFVNAKRPVAAEIQ